MSPGEIRKHRCYFSFTAVEIIAVIGIGWLLRSRTTISSSRQTYAGTETHSGWLAVAYSIVDYIYDVQQLVRQTQIAPMRVIGHSLGAIIALLYSGNYPENVKRLIAVEGMGIMLNQWRMATNRMHEHIRGWVEDVHQLSGRRPRRYATIEEAIRRLQTVNPHLSAEHARHLTIHGSIQNEDGTFSWKFDNYFRVLAPITLSYEETEQIYARISCPTLLVHGQDSWVLHPSLDERVKSMQDVNVHSIANAGHWCHHDQLDEFLQLVRDFL